MIAFAGREKLPAGSTKRARAMRRRMNLTEQRLWKELRKLDANFRRQAPIGPYFADFASYSRHLLVEVDGGVHDSVPDVALRDFERQRWLEQQGFRVLRFTDRQVHGDVSAVVASIKGALLLDGGGLGGGAAAEVTFDALMGANAHSRPSPRTCASTTIPDPSSIEEEGGLEERT